MKFISGQVHWIIVDPDTNEMCMRCISRAEARELARGCGLVIRMERIR